MYCNFGRACGPALFALCFFFNSCSRQPAKPSVQQLAILRFENLSPDSSADWMGRAFSDILTWELMGAPGLDVIPPSRFHSLDRTLGLRTISAPGISSEHSQALAAGASEIAYGEYTVRAGRLEARVTIEDVRTGQMTKVVSASAPSGDVLAAATEVAKQISARVAPYETRSLEALRAYITGTETPDPAASETALNLAIAADPDFGPPYRVLAQMHAAQHDRSGAMAVLERAAARGNSISPIERARMADMAAELANDRAGRQRALEQIVKLEPGDSASWRALADIAHSRHDYQLAFRALEKASELEPENVLVLNTLGYYAVDAGDLAAGMAALQRYQALRPAEANPLDSMGDISLATGHLADAERLYLAAHKKDSNFLADADMMKAAMVRLYQGDLPGAQELAKQYLEARQAAKDPGTAYRSAEWLWISGQRREGMHQLESFAAGVQTGQFRELASRANAELTVWNLVLGDRAAAAKTAQQAMALSGPTSIGAAVLAAFLAQPPATAAEWKARAQQRFAAEQLAPVRNLASVYSLLLNSDFAEAQAMLKQMYDSGTSLADEGLPYVLAWTYLETGNTGEAAALLRPNPAPNANGPGPFAVFFFPRLFYLRGELAEKAGNRDDAHKNYELFLKLSGKDPLIWGEEKKAAAAVR